MDKINISIIKDYLHNSKNDIALKCFLRLYSNYSKISSFSYSELNSLEDKIYTIDGQTLSDRERINKEILIIKSRLSKLTDKKTFEYVNCKLKEIESILSYKDDIFMDYISYLKETISELQAILDLNIYFYNDSCNDFKDKYNALAEDYTKKKIL